MAEETVGDLGEEALIELFSGGGGAIGDKLIVPNGDDCAAWIVDPKHASVITTDTMVEGVHFDLRYTPPLLVGRKLIAVSLSDVAAMGARARYALVSVCFPATTPAEIATKIALGVREISKTFGVAVIGGNTARTSGPIVLTSTVIGRVQPDEIIRRRGTLDGDAIYVTGHLGDARGGLLLAQSGGLPDIEAYSSLYSALMDPQPRLLAGRQIALGHLAHAMCDVSDGIGRDLPRLVYPEGLGARIQAQQLPISAPLRAYAAEAGFSAEECAIKGGEDYELLFTADPGDHQAIVDACLLAGTPVTLIGRVTANPTVEVQMPDGSIIDAPTGFEHYGAQP